MTNSEEADRARALLRAIKRKELNRDKCRLCLGIKGGVPGNENVVDGVVVCDYCTSILLDMKEFRARTKET